MGFSFQAGEYLLNNIKPTNIPPLYANAMRDKAAITVITVL
jgi:hypothetical protein